MEAQIVYNGGGGVEDHAIVAHHQGKACQRLEGGNQNQIQTKIQFTSVIIIQDSDSVEVQMLVIHR